MIDNALDPFDDYVDAYRARGWIGVLPLPYGQKASPPEGFTGKDGRMPETADLDEWRMRPYAQNIALRAAPNVVGIDIDAYGKKQGATTYGKCILIAGVLPPTWRSSARAGDVLSGIRWFRLPAGKTTVDFRDPAHIGPHIEVIRHGYRYACAPPSLHDEGGTYAWHRPDGSLADDSEIPAVGELTELPQAWFNLLAVHAPTATPRESDNVDLGGDAAAKHLGHVPNGSRHTAMNSYAGYLLKTGVPIEAARNAMIARRMQFEGWDGKTPGITPVTDADAIWEIDDVYARYEAGTARQVDITVENAPDRALRVTTASGMRPRATQWLWKDESACWMPLGSLALLAGREGIGKSLWAYWIAAQITTGRLPGHSHGRPRAVVISALEDAWEQTVIPRLIAAGADLSRVLKVEARVGDADAPISLPVDMAELEGICKTRDVGLIILDPLLGVISGRLDTHKDADVRRALEPVSRLAHDIQASVLGLIHLNKGGGDLLTRMMGSRAFSAVARSVLACAEETQETGEEEIELDHARIFRFGQEKNSLGAQVDRSIRYEIEGCTVGFDDELGIAIESSRLVIRNSVAGTVGEHVAMSESSGHGRPGAGREPDSDQWLRARLVAVGPELRSTIVLAAPYSESTLLRALARIGGVSDGHAHSKKWSLPVTIERES